MTDLKMGVNFMTDNEWFTVSQASEKINVPVETIRRYIRAHSVHLKVKKVHKKYFIHDESMTVIEQIRGLYAEGQNVEEVEETLSKRGIPLTLTIKNDHDEVMTVHIVDELKDIKQALKAQKDFNDALLEQMKKQQEYIDHRLEKRDKRLIEAMKESMEVRRQIAAAQEEKKSWWKKIFRN